MNTAYFEEPARRVPVVHDVDVLVAGGGVAGCCAAIAAARLGADTLLVERYGYLGGLVAAWPVPVIFQHGPPDNPIVRGIGEEILQRCRENGVWRDAGRGEDYFVGTYHDGVLDHEMLKLVLMEMLQEAGVRLRLHSAIVQCVVSDNRLRGVVIESKSGREAIRCKQAVDSTGDGDLVELSGAAVERDERGFCSFGVNFQGIDKERVRQLMMYHPEAYAELLQRFKTEADGCKEFGFYTEGTGAFPMSGNSLDAADLTRMETEGSLRVLRSLRWARVNFPGYEHAQVSRVAPQFGVRLGRRLKGVVCLTEADAKAGREFPDVVCRFCYNDRAMAIPYGAIVPERLDGLVVGSRSLSIERNLYGATRLIGTAFGLGHAAGAAAALCVKHGVEFRHLPYAPLRQALLDQRALLDPVYKKPSHKPVKPVPH